MTTSPVKDQVRDIVEKEIDNAHKVVDAITSPIAPVDGVIHGVARGILNWATDTHPEDRNNCKVKCVPNNSGGKGGGGNGGGNGNHNSGGMNNNGGNQFGNTAGNNNNTGNISVNTGNKGNE